MSAHAIVQELGGGSISMRPDGQIVFTDETSCGTYVLNPITSEATCIRPGQNGIRYADFDTHPKDINWIVAIKEDHRNATPETQATHVHNTLVAINIESKEEMTIEHGDDFYSHPKFDPSGKYVSWIQWSHPDMPWTGTVLYVAEWDSGSLKNTTRVAGRAQGQSISQPKWGFDGLLYFANDCTGYWQLYSFDAKDGVIKYLPFKGLETSDFAIAEWRLGWYTLCP